TFVGAAALLQTQIDLMKDDWYDRVEVSIFLCPQDSPVASCAGGEATVDQIDTLRAELEGEALADYVETGYFEAKEEAFEAFSERFSDEWWAQGITADQMQASFRVALVDPEQYQVVSDLFTGRQGVEEVQDQRQVI